MKKYFFLTIFVGKSILFQAQNGLEKIIVEKYYISSKSDTAANCYAGELPIGSVTYRIFTDLLPGYRFQAAYGSSKHELKISTSTTFFNNEEIGNVIPNVIPRRNLKKNTTMLDSWLSVGTAGENYYGILKQDDDSVENIQNEIGFLKSINKKAGIPIFEKDGLISGENIPRPTFFGIDSAVIVFNNKSSGSIFCIHNGAWACLGKGSVGADSLTNNRVLIAQITTDGEFEFELNLQIGTPVGTSENYVARNPTGKEISIPSLIYNSSKKKKLKRVNNRKSLLTK